MPKPKHVPYSVQSSFNGGGSGATQVSYKTILLCTDCHGNIDCRVIRLMYCPPSIWMVVIRLLTCCRPVCVNEHVYTLTVWMCVYIYNDENDSYDISCIPLFKMPYYQPSLSNVLPWSPTPPTSTSSSPYYDSSSFSPLMGGNGFTTPQQTPPTQVGVVGQNPGGSVLPGMMPTFNGECSANC